MGQDWSEQNKHMDEEKMNIRARYVDKNLAKKPENPRNANPDLKRKNVEKIEKLLVKKNYLEDEELITPSRPTKLIINRDTYSDNMTSKFGSIKSNSRYTGKSSSAISAKSSGSTIKEYPILAIEFTEITNFPKFAEEASREHNYKLIPTSVVPYFDRKKAIIIMQPTDCIRFVEYGTKDKHRYITKTFDMKGLEKQEIIGCINDLMTDSLAENLTYVGYYIKNIWQYVFCFYGIEKTKETEDKYEFEFVEINECDQHKMDNIISIKNADYSLFRGMISFVIAFDKKTKQIDYSHLLVFEKHYKVGKLRTFSMIKCAENTLTSENPEYELTEEIGEFCELSESSGKTEFSGVMIDLSNQELYVGFLTEF